MEDVKDDEAKSEGFSNVRSVVLTGKGSFDLVKVRLYETFSCKYWAKLSQNHFQIIPN